jgi:hypothetical protein
MDLSGMIEDLRRGAIHTLENGAARSRILQEFRNAGVTGR